MYNCFLKLFEINILPSHSNQPSSLPLELVDRFLCEGKTGLKFIKIQHCKAKMSVMKVGSRTPATSKMEVFVTVVNKWMLSKIVTKSSILDVTVVLNPV